jgi:hypothetical protein
MKNNLLSKSLFTGQALKRWLASVAVVLALLTAQAGRVFAIVNTHPIEGYADKISVAPEQTINFFIHVPAGRTRYSVEIFRYGSVNAGVNAIGSRVAGPFIGINGMPQDYAANSHEAGAGWASSCFMKVPSAAVAGVAPCTGAVIGRTTWKAGIYTAKIIDLDSAGRDYFHITFIVKDSNATRKSIALLASTNTWQAYNFWPEPTLGGSSIYAGANGVGAAQSKVSFLRPNAYATPETHDDLAGHYLTRPYDRTEHLVAGELRIARWLEANGKRYSMLTDWDLHKIPNVLDPAVIKTVIVSTHSEYWSDPMYKALTAYMDKGGNVISLSGNTCYWFVTLDDAGGAWTLRKDVNWSPQEQASLLGLGSYGASGVGYGPDGIFADSTPYYLRRNGHWCFSTIPGQYFLGYNALITTPRSFSNDGTRGAAGWEVDRTDPLLHVFAREYSDLAESQNVTQESHIVHIRRASAGQVFSVGSVLAGQSLLVDSNFSKTMLNVLAKFSSLSFSDYTGDGSPDLLGRKPDGTLWSYNSDGVGGLGSGVQIASGWTGLDRVLAPGDMDGNGKADLIARSVDGKLWLYKRHAVTGALLPRVQIGTGWNAFDLIVAPGDFDHDGRPDLIARKLVDGSLWLYRGTSTGTLITPAAEFNSGWNIYTNIWAPGDLDEDGHPDLLARSADDKLWFYRGDGNGNVLNGPLEKGTGWDATINIITPGDFDGDRHGDIIARKADGTISLYRGDWAGGTFNGFITPAGDLDNGWDVFSHVVGVW